MEGIRKRQEKDMLRKRSDREDLGERWIALGKGQGRDRRRMSCDREGTRER